MRLAPLATLLSLGAGSLSLMIIPETSLNDKIEVSKKVDTDGLSPEAYAISQLTQTLEIPCDSCPFYTGKDANGATYSRTPNNLLLTLSLDPNARDTISLNGNPLFPYIYTQSAPEPFTVTQKAVDSDAENKVNIGLDLFIETDEHNLSRLRLHVLSVAGFPTPADMSILDFPVFQNEAGEVFIGEVHVRPPTLAEASSVMCKDDMLCRWKAYLYDALHKIAGTRRKGGCHGKKYKHKSHNQGHERPHEHGHHAHKEHEHKWRWYNWVELVLRLVIACVLIAVVTFCIGMFFTLALSAIAHVILVTWWFVTGKVHARPQPVDEEEQALMGKLEESQLESAPEYSDDLPVYVENEEKH